MFDQISKYDDIIIASNHLKIIASELSSVSMHLRQLNDNMKLAIRGSAADYFTNRIVPLGVKKSDELSEKSEALAAKLNIISKTFGDLEGSLEGFDLENL